jgi:hypothetical protein
MAGSIPFPSSRILIKWRQDPESRPSFTIFDALDGPLPFGNGYNFQPTASRGPDGKVWFATGSAIQMIDSDPRLSKLGFGILKQVRPSI